MRDGPAGERRPRHPVPAGAVDAHMHIYDPAFPGAPGGPPPRAGATVADYLALRARLGLARAVIVQPNAYQADNACTLAALAALGTTARAVVAVRPETPDRAIAAMHEAGARGARIMELGGAARLDVMAAVAAKVRPFGWHLIVQLDGRDLPRHEAALMALPVPFVIDHLGRFLAPVPPEHPAFAALLRLLRRGDSFAKLAGVYETSRAGPPDYDDTAALARALLAEAPGRLLWGSNWPHVGVPAGSAPDDADLLDLLARWAPDEALRRRILVGTPSALYGF